jgi:two-component system OmpR family response regulator
VLRRTGQVAPETSRLAFEDLELDEDTREVTRAGEPVELTATEYRCCAISCSTRAAC